MSSESEAAVKGNGSNLPLKTLGKYQIERKIGQGGMGTVYLAKHVDLKKSVALKVLPRDKANNPILVRRFKAEAQAAGQLEHPNIVAVHDAGEADGYLYIAMEYVDGIDLFEYLKRKKVISVKRSIEIVKEVASALQHAFEQNIVHRDIKPSNLLLRNDGVVKITDLGLARSIDDTLETNITRAGTTVGTVDYMAPEQARNSKSADIRSDIYSLGCTWYQMLTGLPPFPDGSMTNKLHAHSTKPLPDPREKNENIPEGIFAILQRMTAKKPEDRYQTPKELLDDLNHSKLTNAEFSDEIFSDLSDDDIVAYDDQADDDDDEDDIVPRKDTRRRKPVSSTEFELGGAASAAKRAKKNRARADENPVPSSKSSKKSKSRDDDPDEPTSHRKRSSPAGDDDNSPSHKTGAGSKPEKGASAATDKNTPAKNSPKPLPPKRQPVVEEDTAPRFLNFETIKYFLFLAGFAGIVVSLGWIFFRWSMVVDDFNVPAPVKTPVASTETPVKTAQAPTGVGETTTPAAVERPVAEYDIAKQPLPVWATTENAIPGNLPNFSVGPGPTTGTHFPTINEALSAAGKNGGVVKLLGNGPFLISAVNLGNVKRLIIMAGSVDDQPLIIVKPTESGSSAGIAINNGELDLRGVHFVLDRNTEPATSPNAIIAVSDGQLFVRDCSFTAMGEATAVVFTSTQDSQTSPPLEPKLLIDRVTARGNGLTGLKLHRTTADVVIKDSLLVTGNAPAIDLAGHLIPLLAETVVQKPRRAIRVLRTTLCARKEVLELAAENTTKPPATEFLFKDSVCSAEGTGNSAVLASATRWPTVTSTSAGWLTNLNWTSISSLYLGFDELLDLERDSFKVTGLDTWQRVWGKKSEANQFQSIQWQESMISDLSSVSPSQFDNAKLPYLEIKTAEGKLPGCVIEQLKVPGVISQSRLFATSQRPKLPSTATPTVDAALVRKVDLTKEDLGQVLNKSDWTSGTLFEVSGSGLRSMSPAKITDRSLRIVFYQTDGQPLKIQPKISEQKTKADYPALFSIENGSLELQSAVLEATQAAKAAASPWLIVTKNASLILKGCHLNGPLTQDLEQHRGLIDWTTTNSRPATTSSNSPILSLTNCFLMSTGTGIHAECSQGNIFLRNCILSIRGYGIDLSPVRSETPLSPVIDLAHVTFSASKAAIRVEPMTSTEPAVSPMRLFVDYCAIVPPLEFKEGEAAEPVLMECDRTLIEQKQIEWWGNSNGVANEVPTLLRLSNADPVTSIVGWNKAWGDANAVRLLTGSKGVMLINTLPNKWANLKAASFNLDPNSPAATWAEGGRALGADPHLVEEAIVAKKQPKETKGAPTKPGTPKPGAGKSNPGF